MVDSAKPKSLRPYHIPATKICVVGVDLMTQSIGCYTPRHHVVRFHIIGCYTPCHYVVRFHIIGCYTPRHHVVRFHIIGCYTPRRMLLDSTLLVVTLHVISYYTPHHWLLNGTSFFLHGWNLIVHGIALFKL